MSTAIVILAAILYTVTILLVVAVGDPAYRVRRMVIFVLLCCAVVYLLRHPLTRWSLNNFEFPVKEVVSGTEFNLKAGLRVIRLRLDGVRLPDDEQERARAKEELIRQINESKVSLEITSPETTGPGPIPVIVTLEGRNLNEAMVEGGYLEGTGPGPPPSLPAGIEEDIEPAPEIPGATADSTAESETDRSPENEVIPPQPTGNESGTRWQRWLLWGFLGLAGSSGLGMIMIGSPFGWLPFLGVAGAAVWSLFRSWQAGISLWPPVVGLILVFLLAGNGAKAARIVKEERRRS